MDLREGACKTCRVPSVNLSLTHPTDGQVATLTSKNVTQNDLDAFLTRNKGIFAEKLLASFPQLAADDRISRLPTSQTIRHEMGHVFHQMNALPSYITLARCAVLGSVILDAVTSHFDRFGDTNLPDFSPRPTDATMHKFVKRSVALSSDVSNYAYSNGLNEFVAGVFSAPVVGSPIGSDNGSPSAFSGVATFAETMAAYQALGGPVPEQACCHVRTGQGAIKKALYKLR